MVLVVETVDLTPKVKAFLGGWRNHVTGVFYYNACTQTEQRGRNGEDMFDRIVQTVDYVDKCVDTCRHKSIQVTFLPDVRDRLVAPGNFVLQGLKRADEGPILDSKVFESVVKIQTFYRANRAKPKAIHLPDVPSETRRTKDTEGHRKDKIDQPGPVPTTYRSTDFVILNRTSPSTRADFELLYNLLDRWRILETQRASNLLFGPSRTALSSLILSKEVELLRTIDSMKTTVHLTRKERSYRKFLDDLSEPVPWKNSDGETIYVDTPRVQIARELRDKYIRLCKENLSIPERVGLLLDVKKHVKLHTCKRSSNLDHLIDQEIDLLKRDVGGENLIWLRKRLKMNFLRLARDSLKDEEDLKWLDSTESKMICKTCGRLLSMDKFRCNRRLYTSCNYCVYLKTRRQPRVVYESYEKMLREVRRLESEAGCYTSLAFLVDCKIIYHLVNDIWLGRSGISENDNLDELRLVRFYKDDEWSPWNSLLLTKQEAFVHLRVPDVEKFYGSFFLQRFRTKNLQSKIYFGSLRDVKNVAK